MVKFIALILLSLINPSVIRVEVEETEKQTSLGSGVCIATKYNQSLIITANHVVTNKKSAKISNINSKVIASNKTWDLAAIVVDQKLPVSRLSNKIPKIGDSLTVCGYGGLNENYHESKGKVINFFSPGNEPNDIIAINVSARSGDSGGPMFYDDGTIGAILFGSDKLGAHGSHCLRIRWFLKQIKGYDELINEALTTTKLYDIVD